MKAETLNIIKNLIFRYPSLINSKNTIIDSVKTILYSISENKKLLICGNGGSASDSDHIVGELMKSFVLKRKITDIQYSKIKEKFPEFAEYYFDNLEGAIRAISLASHTSLMTAFANDKEPQLVFAQQVIGYGDQGDVFLAISTSGNSINVVHAARIAKSLGLKVISLTGKNDSELSKISDISIQVPEIETYKVQELHLPIYHSICLALESEIFLEN